jgi:hypothetical protein
MRHHLAVLTVPYVAFGILHDLYLVDQQNEGGDPTRLLLDDRPLLICITLWIATQIVLLDFQKSAPQRKID